MAYTVLMRLSFLSISMICCPVYGSPIEDKNNFPIEANNNVLIEDNNNFPSGYTLNNSTVYYYNKIILMPTSTLPANTPAKTPAKTFVLHTAFKANWYDAFRHCSENNGRLARIENEEQQREIEQILKSSNDGDNTFFVGGADLVEEGKWTWDLTGPELGEYRKWHHGQPNNSDYNEDCMTICSWETAHYFWNDERCWSDQYFICEY